MKQFILDFARELFQYWGILKYVENLSRPEFSLALFYLSLFGALFIIVSTLLLLLRKEKYLLPSLLLSLLSCFFAAYFLEWRGLLGEGSYFSKDMGVMSLKVIKGVEVRLPEKKGLVKLSSISSKPSQMQPPQADEPRLSPPLSLGKKGEIKIAEPPGSERRREETVKASVPREKTTPPKADKAGKVIEVTGESKGAALIKFYSALFDRLFSLPRGGPGFSQLSKQTQKSLIKKMGPQIQLKWMEKKEGEVSLQGEVKERALRDLLKSLGYKFEPTQVSFKLNKNLTSFEPKEIEKSLPSLIQRRSCFCLNKSYYTSKDNLRKEIEAMRFKIRGGIYQVKVVSIQSIAEGEKKGEYIFKVDFIKRG